jgi:CheY-like chemotaxis protein
VRVLVVEDDASVRQFLCTIFEWRGDQPIAASNGSEALEIAEAFVCDFVVTDFIIPGMNGCELVALLRERQYPAAYLLISGTYEGKPDTDLPFLAKPFTASELLKAVEKVIKASTLQSASPPG